MMNTRTNQTTTVPSTPKRIILASANRHERHSAVRQERARKTLRKMGRFDNDDTFADRRSPQLVSTDETWDD
jgi:hypothetical protein